MKILFSLLFLIIASNANAACTVPCTADQLIADINYNWANNTTNRITPTLLRSPVIEIVNTYFALLAQYQIPSGTIPIGKGVGVYGYDSATVTSPLVLNNGALSCPNCFSSVANVKAYGAVCNGATDDRAAFVLAIATGLPVYVPTGTCVISDMVTLQNGQLMYGDGAVKSIIKALQNFNMSALGLVRLGTGEPGAHLRDLGFDVDQPSSTSVRASLIQYPPAIYANSVPRFDVDRIRCNATLISCLWATGNSGGAYIGRLEVGSLTTGIKFDNSFDFVQMESIECWPYGLDLASNLFNIIYKDGVGECMNIGRIDGLQIGSLGTYRQGLTFTSAATLAVPGAIANLTLDSNAPLTNAGATLMIGNVVGGRILNSAGIVEIANYQNSSGIATPDVDVTGGRVFINGGVWLHQDLTSSAGKVSGTGMLVVNNIYSNIANGDRTAPVFSQSGASATMRLSNIAGAAVTIGRTGNSYEFLNDNQDNFVSNSFWPNLLPNIPFTSSVGYYDVVEAFTPTITPTFATVGDFVPANVVTTGSIYQRKGNFVHAQFSVTFDTNAFTTATGAFSLNTNFPTGKQSVTPCTLSGVGNVTTTAVQVSAEFQTPALFFRSIVSNTAMGSWGTGQVPASKTGVLLRGECTYQVRS